MSSLTGRVAPVEGPASCNNELSVNEGVQAEARGLLLGMWQRLGGAASELWFCAGLWPEVGPSPL